MPRASTAPNLRNHFDTATSRGGGSFRTSAYMAEFCTAFNLAARADMDLRTSGGVRVAGCVRAELDRSYVYIRWDRPSAFGGGAPIVVHFGDESNDGYGGYRTRPFQRVDRRVDLWAGPGSAQHTALDPVRGYARTAKLPDPVVLAEILRPPSWSGAAEAAADRAAARAATDAAKVDTAMVAFHRDLAAGNWAVIEGLATAAAAKDRDALRAVIEKAQSLYAQSVANRLRLLAGKPASQPEET